MLSIISFSVTDKEDFAFSETFLEKTSFKAFPTGIFHFSHLILYVPPAR